MCVCARVCVFIEEVRAGPRGERGAKVVDDGAELEADRRREVVDGTAEPEVRSARG